MGILPVPIERAGETPTPQLDNLFFGYPLIGIRNMGFLFLSMVQE
jgi:hypothetical protein